VDDQGSFAGNLRITEGKTVLAHSATTINTAIELMLLLFLHVHTYQQRQLFRPFLSSSFADMSSRVAWSPRRMIGHFSCHRHSFSFKTLPWTRSLMLSHRSKASGAIPQSFVLTARLEFVYSGRLVNSGDNFCGFLQVYTDLWESAGS
jgi:hypothetical protein